MFIDSSLVSRAELTNSTCEELLRLKYEDFLVVIRAAKVRKYQFVGIVAIVARKATC